MIAHSVSDMCIIMFAGMAEMRIDAAGRLQGNAKNEKSVVAGMLVRGRVAMAGRIL